MSWKQMQAQKTWEAQRETQEAKTSPTNGRPLIARGQNETILISGATVIGAGEGQSHLGVFWQYLLLFHLLPLCTHFA